MSDNHDLASYLAAQVTSTTAQKALFDTSSRPVTYALAGNQSLSKEIWLKLAKLRSDVELTHKLVAEGPQDLDEDQLRLLLKDSRVRVHDSLFYYQLGNISREFFNELTISGKLNSATTGHWLYGERIPPELLADVARIEAGYRQAELLRHRYLYTDEQANTVLPELRARRTWNSSNLWGLFDSRPALLPCAIRSGNEAVLIAASTSRHLFSDEHFMEIISRTTLNQNEWDSVTIAKNVLAHPNASAAVTTAAAEFLTTQIVGYGYELGVIRAKVEIEYLTRANRDGLLKTTITQDWATLPDELLAAVLAVFHAAPHRYPTLFTLESDSTLYAPQLPDRHLAKIRDYQTPLKRIGVAPGYLSVSCITTEHIQTQLQPALDAVGYKAWQTFVELSQDWSTSVKELLETTLALF